MAPPYIDFSWSLVDTIDMLHALHTAKHWSEDSWREALPLEIQKRLDQDNDAFYQQPLVYGTCESCSETLIGPISLQCLVCGQAATRGVS